MAKLPVIRNAILGILTSAERPLPFSEVQRRACAALVRNRIDGKTISEGLKSLQNAKLIEKEIVGGRAVWSLTSKHYISSLQTAFQRLVTKGVSGDIGKILDNGMTHMTVPYTVFLIPPQDEYAVADKSGMSVTASWASPAYGISSVLFNDFLCLDSLTVEGIRNLLMWAYWVGVREYIDDFLSGIDQGNNMQKELTKLKAFVSGQMANAIESGDSRGASGEEAIFKILSATEELIVKPNLKEFVGFANKKRMEVRDLQRVMLEAYGHYMATGEKLFDNLTMDLGDRVFDGLNSVGQWKKFQVLLPKHMLAALDVWNEFISTLFGTMTDSAMEAVSGDIESSKNRLVEYLQFLPSLAQLMKKRKVGAIYLWGFPEIDAEAEKEFRFSTFDDWLEAVKRGDLDHRVWLFEGKTIERIRKAYHAVRMGKEPLPLRVDKENWTLRDIYIYHPTGKDPKFWLSILETIQSRNAPENLEHRKKAVPEGFYSEFKKRERAAVVEGLDAEEREVLGPKDNSTS